MKGPRRIALFLLPISLAATAILIAKNRRPPDPFGLLAGPTLRVSRARAGIVAVTLSTSDPRARALVDAIGDAPPLLSGSVPMAAASSPLTVRGGGREIALDPTRGEVSDTKADRRYRVADPGGLRKAIGALSPELYPPATGLPKG